MKKLIIYIVLAVADLFSFEQASAQSANLSDVVHYGTAYRSTNGDGCQRRGPNFFSSKQREWGDFMDVLNSNAGLWWSNSTIHRCCKSGNASKYFGR